MMRPPLRCTSVRCRLSARTRSTSSCRPVNAGYNKHKQLQAKRVGGLGLLNAKAGPGLLQQTSPAKDCCPSRRCVCPLSCPMSFPGNRPVLWMCCQWPTPYFIRHSFSTWTSSRVQPGAGVQFHLAGMTDVHVSMRCMALCCAAPCSMLLTAMQHRQSWARGSPASR